MEFHFSFFDKLFLVSEISLFLLIKFYKINGNDKKNVLFGFVQSKFGEIPPKNIINRLYSNSGGIPFLEYNRPLSKRLSLIFI